MASVRLKPHGHVFLFFCCSVVVPPTKGLELLRFVVEVYLKFFLRCVYFVHCNGSWAQSVALNNFAVFTRFIFLFFVVFVLHRTIRNLRFHMTISTRRLKNKKPSETCDSHHALNEVPHRLKFIGTVTLCDCLRAESNIVNDYASVAVRAGIDRAVFDVFVWSGTCITCAPWKGVDVLCAI